MTLSEKILQQMVTDDECPDDKDRQILRVWSNACAHEREAISRVMVALCGWSFETLQAMADGKNDAS